jgi:hypothetical protein
MRILCWRWSLYSTWPFSLSSLKSSPRLSVLLSVEEHELLVIPYCHVFENHLHFLSLWLICPSTLSYYHQVMIPIIHHIVITDFHPVPVASSSSTYFLLLPQQNMSLNTPPSWISWNYLSNGPSYTWNGFRKRELCLFYSGDAICPKLISDAHRAMFLPYLLVCVFKIDDSWCVGKEIWRSFWILIFLPLFISEHVLKSWWKQRLPSQAL